MVTGSKDKKRIHFIDQCKGIGIILIVYVHCFSNDYLYNHAVPRFFFTWCYSFHVPLFFIIGGCLIAYKQEGFRFPETLKKKAKRLLLPGFYFSLLSIILLFGLKIIAREDYLKYLTNSALDLLKLVFSNAMWFLPCYFFAEIIFLLLMKKVFFRWQPLIICSIFFLVSAVASLSSVEFVSIRLSRLSMAICMVGLGYTLYEVVFSKLLIVSNEKSIITQKRNKISIIAVGGIFLILGAIAGYYNEKVSCHSANFGNSIWLFLFSAILGSVGLILVLIAINKKIPPLDFFGKNSLTVLCTHMFIIDLFWMINGKLFHIEFGDVNAFLLALVTIILEIPVILLINRFFPWLIGMKKDRAHNLSKKQI